MRERRLLITGASGFIGSRLALQALQRGWEVIALVLPGEGGGLLDASRQQVRIVEGTLADLSSWQSAVLRLQPRACVHLAWNATPGAYLATRENLDWLTWSVQLLLQLPNWGCRQFIGVGSSAEYDARVSSAPLGEAAALGPESLYGACKASLSLIGQQIARQSGLGFGWARVFHPYGPGEHPERLVSSCIRSLLAGRRFEASAGTQVRDFLHVDDVASALLAMVEGQAAGTVNVCSGVPTTVRKLLETIGEATGRGELVAIGALPQRAWDPEFLSGDNSRLRSLGWQPQFTLASGVADAVSWWSHQPSIAELTRPPSLPKSAPQAPSQ